ncbi:erythromycin esterase family protein [Embleya sp. NPDC001921]
MKSDDVYPSWEIEAPAIEPRRGPGATVALGLVPARSPARGAATVAGAPGRVAAGSASPTDSAAARGDPAWALAHSAHALGSTLPGGSEADLRAFDTMVGGADVVGVGEATYGSSEFCTVKHRLFRHLVERRGFRSLVLTVHRDAGVRLDAWVLHGTGHLRTIMDEEFRAGDSPWNTTETRDLFRWMRVWNVRRPDSPVRVAGNGVHCAFDAADEAARRHRDRVAADNTLWWQRHTGTRVFFSAHNAQIATEGRAGAGTQGSVLRERLGARYVSAGFTFGQGSFNAIDKNAPGAPWRRFAIGPPAARTGEDVLERVSRRDWYLDTRAATPGVARDWIAAAHPTRSLGVAWPCDEYENTRLRASYDILIHLHQIGATHRRDVNST